MPCSLCHSPRRSDPQSSLVSEQPHSDTVSGVNGCTDSCRATAMQSTSSLCASICVSSTLRMCDVCRAVLLRCPQPAVTCTSTSTFLPRPSRWSALLATRWCSTTTSNTADWPTAAWSRGQCCTSPTPRSAEEPHSRASAAHCTALHECAQPNPLSACLCSRQPYFVDGVNFSGRRYRPLPDCPLSTPSRSERLAARLSKAGLASEAQPQQKLPQAREAVADGCEDEASATAEQSATQASA